MALFDLNRSINPSALGVLLPAALEAEMSHWVFILRESINLVALKSFSINLIKLL